MIGVVYIAYGPAAQREQRYALAAYIRGGYGWPVLTIDDGVFPTADKTGRMAKVNLFDLAPWDDTLYMDADTRVLGNISAIPLILADGWDFVICPSRNQGDECLWHVGQDEREATFDMFGFVPLQLQGGVFAWRKNERTREFFYTWRDEWFKWRGQDQGALLRAMQLSRLRVWLLSHDFNGGSIIEHRFGMAARKD